VSGDSAGRWAAADDMVDGFVKGLRSEPMSSAELAMALLAIEHPQRLQLMAMIAATSLQRLANGSM
jgi:hypothetical protein